MTTTDKYSVTVITHQAPHLISLKTGDAFSWMAFIKEDEGLYEVSVSLVKLNSDEDLEPRKSDRIFQELDDAQRYITSTTRHFAPFELKIFRTDEKYDQEFLENKIVEWIEGEV